MVRKFVIICLVLICSAVMLDSLFAMNMVNYQRAFGNNPSICESVYTNKIVKVTTNPNTENKIVTLSVAQCKWDGKRGDGIVNAYTTLKCGFDKVGNQICVAGQDVACGDRQVCVLKNSYVKKIDSKGNPIIPMNYIWIPICQNRNN